MAAALVVLFGAFATCAEPAADLTLTGVMTRADHQTYREIPFRVPAGTTRLTVRFAYTGKAQKSVIDLGVRDPRRFRGWSGGNKQSFTISEADATPSYLPGPLPVGVWKLVLGVPNLRAGAQARYTAQIHFDRGPAFAGRQLGQSSSSAIAGGCIQLAMRVGRSIPAAWSPKPRLNQSIG